MVNRKPFLILFSFIYILAYVGYYYLTNKIILRRKKKEHLSPKDMKIYVRINSKIIHEFSTNSLR